MVATRHHLHRNPELSGAEAQTAALVAEKLRGWGVEDVRTGLAGHGVTGILRGQTDGPMFALRADMDALPVQETSGLPYASCHAGVMHACGHDGHTATLLGAAQALSQLKDHLPGPVKFLFQPAEETTGGADAMIAEGALEGVESIVALHGWPNLEIGQIGYRAGPMMASADRFDLTIRGKGGHAAYSHTTVDPVDDRRTDRRGVPDAGLRAKSRRSTRSSSRSRSSTPGRPTTSSPASPNSKEPCAA